MVSKKRALYSALFVSVVCLVNGVISGHAVCAHQHVTSNEANKMLRDSKGNINCMTYFANIIRDYVNMHKDPLGLETGLK